MLGLACMLAGFYFKRKGGEGKKSITETIAYGGTTSGTEENYMRDFSEYEGTQGTFTGPAVRAVDPFSSRLFVMFSKDADGGIHRWSPQAHPGLLLPNLISLQTS